MRIAITGATGYIGTALVEYAHRHGVEVWSLSRRQGAFDASYWLAYDLAGNREPLLPSDLDAVVHLATAAQLADEAQVGLELKAAELLMSAARKQEARFVYISSQTASPDAPTFYGRSKWLIESNVLAGGGWVIRPGLVYGGREAGLYGLLSNVVRRLPLLPAFLPAPMVQPIHMEQLCRALLKVSLDSDVPARAYNLAAHQPVSFTRFMAALAYAKCGRRPLFMPVPVICIRLLAGLLGKRLSLALGVGRLLSLFDQPRIASAADFEELDISAKSLRRGLRSVAPQNSGQRDRRPLLEEARILFSYIMKRPGIPMAARRYVRAIETLRRGAAVQWPTAFQRFPALVGVLGGRGFRTHGLGEEVDYRLRAAILVAEASRAGALRFIGSAIDARSRKIEYAVVLFRVAAGELMIRLTDRLAGRLLRRSLMKENPEK